MNSYSFIDNNYFNKDDISKDIFNVSREFKNVEDVKPIDKKCVLNLDVLIKDIQKGS